MKVQAINNTQFKGLYTNKSAENKGNWKVEYRPYSWEMKNQFHFGTGPQTDIDIIVDYLPDNEKIFTPPKILTDYHRYGEKTGRESCKDILGTEYYYNNHDTKIMRNHIDHLEAMNREDSLNVLHEKLGKFMQMKEYALNDIESGFETQKEKIKKFSDEFDKYSRDYNRGIFDRTNSRSLSKSYMETDKYEIMDELNKLYDNIHKYATIRKSIGIVRNQRAKIAEESLMLKAAREAGNLIDISQRVYVFDPNKPLWDALHNVENVIGKIVALPNKTISIKNILAAIEAKADTKDIPDKAIKYIDELIKHKI